MSKLTNEQRIEIYSRRKNGEHYSQLTSIYGINRNNISYLIRLIDMHGTGILRRNKNRYYSPEFKQAVMDRILVGKESMTSVAIDIGLISSGILGNWIRAYKKNGYNVIEKKRGRRSMTKSKVIVQEDLSPEEKVKELEQRLQYVEAENEYLKKLKAVMDQRAKREKKKKQK